MVSILSVLWFFPLIVTINCQQIAKPLNRSCEPLLYHLNYEFHGSYTLFTNKIQFRMNSGVSECVFDGEISFIDSFTVIYRPPIPPTTAIAEIVGYPGKIVLKLPSCTLEPNYYEVTFEGRIPLYHSPDGFAVRFFREQTTMKRTWYAMFNFDKDNCGDAYQCINNPLIPSKYRIAVTHVETHTLVCSGLFRHIEIEDESIPEGMTRTTCEVEELVLPNHVYLLLSTFAKLEIQNKMRIITPFHVGHVFPMVGRWFGDLLKTMMVGFQENWIKLDWLLMPSDTFRKEYIVKNACFLSINLASYPGSPQLHQQIYHCLFMQKYKFNSLLNQPWSIWLKEGIIEFMSLQFQKKITNSTHLITHYSIVDGPIEEMTAINSTKSNRKKTSMLLQMIYSFYPNVTGVYEEIVNTPGLLLESQEVVLTKFAGVLEPLGLNLPGFIKMIESWINPRGYPTIVADVEGPEICITQRDNGPDKYRGYVFPILIIDGITFKMQSFGWTDPELLKNCYEAKRPYLINYQIPLLARTRYDPNTYSYWGIYFRDKRNNVDIFEKARIINDLGYFVRHNVLPVRLILPYLLTFHFETDTVFWETIAPTLDHLDIKLRNSPFYTEFQMLMAGSIKKYYDTMANKTVPTGVAVKWGCYLKIPDCLKYAEMEVHGVVEYYSVTPLEETICAGMRNIDSRTVNLVKNTMFTRDIRGPMFYLNMLTCVEDSDFQRKLLNSIFLLEEYSLPPRIRKDFLIGMIRNSRTGMYTIIDYLRDTPIMVLEDLGVEYFLDFLDVVADYIRDLKFFNGMDSILDIKTIVTPKQQKHYELIATKVLNNSRWMENNYDDLKHFFIDDTSVLIDIQNQAIRKRKFIDYY